MGRLRLLGRDQSGHILLPALAAGTALVGVSMYMTETWRDIQMRESTQIAADAIAASGVSWLAAGMNVLALINVLMAVVLSLFVAYRAAELIAVTVAVVAGAFAWTGVGAAIAGPASQIATRLLSNEKKVADPIMKALNVATTTEKAVAVAFPYLSVGASALAAYTDDHRGDNDDHTGFGFAVSLSLAPTKLDQMLNGTAVPVPERMGSLSGEHNQALLTRAQSKLPKKLQGLTNLEGINGSLPVEGEDYAQLCSRGAERWSSLLSYTGVLGPVAKYADKAASVLGGNLPVVLCQPLADTLDKLKEEAKQAAQKEAEEKVDKWSEGYANSRCKHLKYGTDERNKCVDEMKAERKASPKGKRRMKTERRAAEDRQEEELNKIRNAQQAQTDSIKTAQIWTFISEPGLKGDEANLFMNVWGLYEDLDRKEQAAKTPSFVALSRPLVAGSRITDWGTVKGYNLMQSSAKARMYFQCPSKQGNVLWGLGASGRPCSENAMWVPGNWTWVLGKDRMPGDEISRTGQQALSGYAGFLLSKGIQTVIGKAAVWVLGKGERHSTGIDLLERLRANHTAPGAADRWGNITYPNWDTGNKFGDWVNAQIDDKLR